MPDAWQTGARHFIHRFATAPAIRGRGSRAAGRDHIDLADRRGARMHRFRRVVLGRDVRAAERGERGEKRDAENFQRRFDGCFHWRFDGCFH